MCISHGLAANADGASHVALINDMHDVPKALAPDLLPGDVVLVLGAGSIGQIIAPLLNELAKH